jgi:hypothetical protein
MNRLGTARNIAIVLVIAAVVEFLPGGGRFAETFGAVLWVGFYTGLAYLGVMLYREHRITLYSLGTRHRAQLYGAVAVVVTLAAARVRMWETGLGELAWFVLAGASAYALVAVYRFWRAY